MSKTNASLKIWSQNIKGGITVLHSFQTIISCSVGVSVIEWIFAIKVEPDSNLSVHYAILNLGKKSFSSCSCAGANLDIPLQWNKSVFLLPFKLKVLKLEI